MNIGVYQSAALTVCARALAGGGFPEHKLEPGARLPQAHGQFFGPGQRSVSRLGPTGPMARNRTSPCVCSRRRRTGSASRPAKPSRRGGRPGPGHPGHGFLPGADARRHARLHPQRHIQPAGGRDAGEQLELARAGRERLADRSLADGGPGQHHPGRRHLAGRHAGGTHLGHVRSRTPAASSRSRAACSLRARPPTQGGRSTRASCRGTSSRRTSRRSSRW